MAVNKILEKQAQTRKEVAEYIIDFMDQNKLQLWELPFSNVMVQSYNAKRQTEYQGGNKLRILKSAMEKGYTDPRWLSDKDIKELGLKIKKGEKATRIEYWIAGKPVEVEDEADKTSKKTKTPMYLRIGYLFNAAQIEGMPPYLEENNNPLHYVDKYKELDTLLKYSEAKIVPNDSNYNRYQLFDDTIHLQSDSEFKSKDHYYAVALYEIVRSTMHESRLNLYEDYIDDAQSINNKIQMEASTDLAYSMLNSKYKLPIRDEVLPNEEDYKRYSTSNYFKENPNELFKAFRTATKMVDFIEQNMLEPYIKVQKLNKMEYPSISRPVDITKDKPVSIPDVPMTAPTKETPTNKKEEQALSGNDLTEKFSITPRFYETVSVENPSGNKIFIAGGGINSFGHNSQSEQYVIDKALTSENTISFESLDQTRKSLGGHVFEFDKRLNGSKAFHLIEELHIDDITGHIEQSGYSKFYFDMSIPSKDGKNTIELKNCEIAIHDGNNFSGSTLYPAINFLEQLSNAGRTDDEKIAIKESISKIIDYSKDKAITQANGFVRTEKEILDSKTELFHTLKSTSSLTANKGHNQLSKESFAAYINDKVEVNNSRLLTEATKHWNELTDDSFKQYMINATKEHTQHEIKDNAINHAKELESKSTKLSGPIRGKITINISKPKSSKCLER